MKNAVILSVLLMAAPVCFAQQAEQYPLGAYEELTDTKPFDDASVWNRMKKPVELSWGSTDVRYKKLNVPVIKQTRNWQGKAWKGERINAQAVLWTNENLDQVTVSVTDLKSGSSIIPASDIQTQFVRYVMTDELNKDGKGGCGVRENKAEWDSSLVADVLDIVDIQDIKARTTQPLWMTIRVPQDAKAGKYKGTLTVSAANAAPQSLNFEVEVLNRTLPAPADWAFHLDLWQNPYAVARYYQVPLWSEAHFEAMLPVMKMLADAGQKVITTTIMHKPWAGQTEDHFDSMVFRQKNIDGTWTYDYTVFDTWVEFMMNEVGIKDQINCYTLIPWALTFDYFDQATNRTQFINTKPGDAEYEAYWGNFLKDFSKHLREKGWFDITTIAMDERPMEAMIEAIKVIQTADPEFKISLAGNFHPEIQADLYDLCIPYGHTFPEDVKAEREAKGQISTVYTCCAEPFPNIFTFSEPAEATWTILHSVAGNYDGYLRWAVNSWTADPLRDSRFRTWAAGDTYFIYPGPRSSIRYERFLEGIQDAEKIRILRDELAAKGATSQLKKLNEAIARFTPEGMSANSQTTAEMVEALEKMLNSY